MTKVTYYFGAGASIGTLPIVNQIPDWIEDMIKLLSSDSFKLSDHERFDPNDKLSKYAIQKEFLNDLGWLKEHAKNHASIDTFAKKLFLKDNERDLVRLKIALSMYFVLEQAKNETHKRYDAFFASILNDTAYNFPDNIRVLSWNYDFQFEKSYSEYSNNNKLKDNQDFLNVITKYSRNKPSNNRFSIIKLNGTTTITDSSGFQTFNLINTFEGEITKELLEYILKTYDNIRKAPNYIYGLSFAWERIGYEDRDIITHAKTDTIDTEVLVVIGYSFPFFNREIDREIIKNMKNLRKVYFQAPDAEILKERFLSIRDDIADSSLLCRYDVGQFLLPNEL